MTNRERLLEAELAWLQYGSERMNLVLRERNTVSNDDESDEETGEHEHDDDDDKEGSETAVNTPPHTIVCGCKKCTASHRFGAADPDNIFNSFDDDAKRECVVKKCLKYHCERAVLVCIETIAELISHTVALMSLVIATDSEA